MMQKPPLHTTLPLKFSSWSCSLVFPLELAPLNKSARSELSYIEFQWMKTHWSLLLGRQLHDFFQAMERKQRLQRDNQVAHCLQPLLLPLGLVWCEPLPNRKSGGRVPRTLRYLRQLSSLLNENGTDNLLWWPKPVTNKKCLSFLENSLFSPDAPVEGKPGSPWCLWLQARRHGVGSSEQGGQWSWPSI